MSIDLGKRKRLWLILFSGLAVTAVAILASGLSDLDMTYEGHQLPRVPRGEEQQQGEAPPPSRLLEISFRVLFTVAGALLPFAILLYLVLPQVRRRVLRDLIALFIVMIPLYLLWRFQPEATETLDDFQMPQATPQDIPPSPDVAYVPEPRAWLILAATIGVALLLAALLVGLGWYIWRRRQRPSPSMDKLAQEAQEAIDAIEAGADLKDTVTKCYFEMMQVLKDQRGVQRQRAMTPREFEAELEGLGVPTAQVRRLTRLFEAVRYGDKQLGEQEERQAVVSLTSIVRSCRSTS